METYFAGSVESLGEGLFTRAGERAGADPAAPGSACGVGPVGGSGERERRG